MSIAVPVVSLSTVFWYHWYVTSPFVIALTLNTAVPLSIILTSLGSLVISIDGFSVTIGSFTSTFPSSSTEPV